MNLSTSFITLVLDLLLKEYIICGSELECASEVFGDDDVHDVDLFDVDSVLIEAHVEVVLEGRRQLTLDVPDLADLDSSDVVSDGLLALLSQQLLQLVST